MKLKVAAAAAGLATSVLVAPTAAHATPVHPNACSYSYAMWYTSGTVNLSGSRICDPGPGGLSGPAYVVIFRVDAYGNLQYAADSAGGLATYHCQGTTLNTYKAGAILNGEQFTLTDVPCS